MREEIISLSSFGWGSRPLSGMKHGAHPQLADKLQLSVRLMGRMMCNPTSYILTQCVATPLNRPSSMDYSPAECPPQAPWTEEEIEDGTTCQRWLPPTST